MARYRDRRPGHRVRRDAAVRCAARAGHAHAEQLSRRSRPRPPPVTMPPLLRKAVLATHIGTSVGWLGALLAYLALDITVATGANIDTVRGAAIAMDLLVRYAIVPLAIASVFIGIIN